MMTTNERIEQRWYVSIKFSKDPKHWCLIPVCYYRNGMTFEFYCKWLWYFEYRVALLRVKYPKCKVEMRHGSYDYILPSDFYETKLRNLLTASKAKKTEFENKIQKARENWNSFFPIEEDVSWNKVQAKLKEYTDSVTILQNDLDKHLLDPNKLDFESPKIINFVELMGTHKDWKDDRSML